MTSFQGQQHPSLSLNTVIPSEGSSPNGSSISLLQNPTNTINDATRRQSLQSSPINLTSSLSNFSLSGSTSNLQSSTQDTSYQTHPSPDQDQHQLLTQYIIKIKNVPSDITLRESYCIFAFAKDFLGLELAPDSNNLPVIFARFKSLSAASTYSQILESNQIFGPTYPFYVKAEIVDQPSQLNLGSLSKRPSVGNQRSRFLFSDPFSNEPIQENIETLPTPLTTSAASLSNNNSGVGKSLLLMESQRDAREYEQLVRDPWQQPTSQHQQQQQQQLQNQLGSSTHPSSAVSLSAGAYTSSNPQTPSVDWDRRRQSSAFFNNQSPLLSTQVPASSSQIASQLSLSGQLPPAAQTLSMGSTSIPIAPASAPASQSSASSQIPQLIQQQQQPISVQSALNNNSQQSSQVDLSLLARVPPPANPADQNPPCNTLYVGNLPPDATEAELRQLFQPQRGFRRLSFRTKVQPNNGTGVPINNHSHGPMCFVEFEDVVHATRALAELYGRTLPRPGGAVPGKGGIRLSFSKNPLGVRGPGQRRSSGFAFQQGAFKN